MKDSLKALGVMILIGLGLLGALGLSMLIEATRPKPQPPVARQGSEAAPACSLPAPAPAPGPEVLRYSLLLTQPDGRIVGSAVALEVPRRRWKTHLKGTHALTARHCVELLPAGDSGPWTVLLEDSLRRIRRARVSRHSTQSDLSLLELESSYDLQGARLADDKPVPGEDAWLCGYGDGVPWNLVRGHVSAPHERGLLIHGQVWYGHSGSGVFLARKGRPRLAGIVSESFNPPSPRHSRTPTVCVPAEKIKAFLEGRE